MIVREYGGSAMTHVFSIHTGAYNDKSSTMRDLLTSMIRMDRFVSVPWDLQGAHVINIQFSNNKKMKASYIP